MAVQPSRYRALIAVVAAITLGFAVVDGALRAYLGLLPEDLIRNEYLNPEELAAFGGRVVAVSAAPPKEPLAVVLGFSTAREAFVPSLLEGSRSADAPRWLNLGGSGASFYELSYYTKPLFHSSLRPDTIVVGMHPVWMAGRVSNPVLLEAGPSALASSLMGARVGTARKQLMEWSFLAFNRNRINLGLERTLSSARERAFLELGLSQALLYPAAAEPWTEERRYEGKVDAKLRAMQMGAWERFHWFEPARYRRVSTEAHEALKVIRACQRIARRVVLVYMPEGTELRERIPADAQRAFEEAVLSQLAERLPVIDLRAALPESAFYDHIHVNESGRPIASTLLVERLAAL